MQYLELISGIMFFLICAFSVIRVYKSGKQKHSHVWFSMMIFSIIFTILEVNTLFGFSKNNAIRQANEYLVREIGSPRDGWKIAVTGEGKVFGKGDAKHYLLKYQHSTHLGFLEAYWTKERKFKFIDCTEKLLNK